MAARHLTLPRARAARTCPMTCARACWRCRRRPASCRMSSWRWPTGPRNGRAFMAYHDALLLKETGNLSKGEREMIIVATSAANQCLYCVVAHGAILRIYEKKPLVADQLAVNHRKADITPRQKRDARLRDEGLHRLAQAVEDADFAALRGAWPGRRGRLGHRRHHGVFRPEQPHGQRDRACGPNDEFFSDGARAPARPRPERLQPKKRARC